MPHRDGDLGNPPIAAIPSRLLVLDFIKGLGILNIIWHHLFFRVGRDSYASFWGTSSIIARPFGPAAFVFCSTVATLFSLYRNERKSIDKKTQESQLIKRVLVYFLVGVYFNHEIGPRSGHVRVFFNSVVFADSFESGDCTKWSTVVGESP